jgi:hypothetical protein
MVGSKERDSTFCLMPAAMAHIHHRHELDAGEARMHHKQHHGEHGAAADKQQ